MMTKEIAQQVMEQLRGTPFVMALLVINIIVLIGFALTLREVSQAMERREAIFKDCMNRRT